MTGGKIAEAFGAESLGLDGAKGSLDELDAQFAATAADAKTAVAEIDAAFGSMDATVVGGAAAGGKGAAGDDGAVASEDEGSSAGSSLLEGGLFGSVLSKAIMPLVGVGIGIGGAEAGTNDIQGLSNFADQLGVPITQAWQTQLATSAVGGDSRLETQLSKLQSDWQSIETTQPTLEQGTGANLGRGRMAVEPTSVQAALNVGGLKGAAEGASILFGSPTAAADQMQGMSPPDQLALIVTKLDEIANANEKVQVTNDLFGTRGGVSLLPLLENYQGAMGMAGQYIKGTGSETAKELQGYATAGGKQSVEEFGISTAGTETSVEVGLAKLDPTLTSVEKAITQLVSWLEHHGSTIDHIAHTAGDVLRTATAPVSAAYNALTGRSGGNGNASWEESLGAGGIEGVIEGSTYLGKELTGPIDSAYNFAKGIGGDVLGAVGICGGTPKASAAETSSHTSARAAMSSIGVDTSAQGTAMDAIIAAADKYGRNPEAMLASSYAESSLIPTSQQQGGGGGSGLFQFSQGTFDTDYDKLYGKDPTKAAGM